MRAMRWPLVAFLSGAMVVMVSAQQPGGGGRGKVNLTGQVATNAALQEELKVTEEQKTKLKAASEKFLASMKDRFSAFKDAAGDKEKLQELIAKGQKEAEENAKAVEALLTSDQKARIKQVEVQIAGVRAFGSDETVASLKLEDGQKTKIKGILEEFSKDVKEVGGGGFGKGGFDKEKAAEAAKKREKLEKGALADISEVLNDTQRKAWMDLTGPAAADLAKIRAGQFGGFGLGGGGFGNKGKGQKKVD